MKRKAFTLIEMMMVIGLIAFLAVIGVLAYGHISHAVASSSTKSTLHEAQALLGEYDATSGMSNLGSEMKQRDPSTGLVSLQFDKYNSYQFPAGKVYSPGPDYPVGENTDYPAGPVTPEYREAEVSDPKGVVYNTAFTMMLLNRNPQVAAIVAKLPPKSLMPQQVQIKGGFNQAAPVLVDAWANPIIFVPAGGLSTTLSGQPTLIRTTGIITPFNPAAPPPLKPGDRPFFASAGADGNFDNGDDNLYSFE